MWDLKSEAEVILARKLKGINEEGSTSLRQWNIWDKWWLRRDQKDGRNWQDKAAKHYKVCQEILAWRLEEIHMEARAKYI